MKRAAAAVLVLILGVLVGPTVRSAGTLHFTDNTRVAGFDLTPDIGGHHGSFVADYDNDGDDDIFMSSHGIGQADDTGWNALFRNRGDGIFDEVAGVARLQGQTGGATPVAGVDIYGRFTHEMHGASWIDYDNDGDFDLYEPDTDSNKAVSGPGRQGHDELYRNNGDGSFTRVSTQVGFPAIDYGRRGAVAGDFDRDGFLDLFVLQMIEITLDPTDPYKSTHAVPSPYRSMYFNQGGTSFCLEGTTGCRPATGIQYTGWSQGVTTLDYDQDGDVDILEASEFNSDGLRLWENDGSAHFQNVAAARGLPGAGSAVNCVVGADVDNDGDIDIYTWFDNNGSQAGRLYRNEIECRPDIQPDCTPASKGKRFTLVNSSLGGAEHMFFGDLDNDGDLDLVSGGVFLNNGNGTFVAETGSGLLAQGRGGMVLDADGDGDLDVVMNRSDRTYPYRGFYVNDLSNGLGYLKVKLTGRGGQAGAPGAKLSVYEEGFLGDPLHRLGYREVVTATGGFVDGPSPVQHFGLGHRSAVDVRVTFVTGEVVDRASVLANTLVQVRADESAAPVISNLQAAPGSTSATVTWTTNKASDSRVRYGTSPGTYANDTGVVQTGVTSHSVTLGSLTAGTTYYYVAMSSDGVHPPTSSSERSFRTTAVDTTPPLISSVAASNLTPTSARISWTTNEGSDSQVDYGLTTSYGSSSTLDTQLVTSHAVNLSGLAVGTAYHFRVRSRDAAGNLATSSDATFVTLSPDLTPPVISSVAASSLTQTSARISWTTNEGSDSQVDYGLTTSYGSSSALDTQLVTSHAVNLSGLAVGTSYHFRVRSRDAAGNLAIGSDATFVTLSGPLFSDSFSSTAIDTTKWVRGTNAGNRAAIVSGQLELRSQGFESGWVATRNSFAGRNTIVRVKVTQPNDDGALGLSPTYTASATTGFYGASTWYRFYTYRSSGSGPYRLFAQWKRSGVVNGQDVTGSLVINGAVYLRLRMDTTRIHFEASLDANTWVDTYNEVFALPGYTIASSFYYELAGYRTDVKGVLRVDDFSISATP